MLQVFTGSVITIFHGSSGSNIKRECIQAVHRVCKLHRRCLEKCRELPSELTNQNSSDEIRVEAASLSGFSPSRIAMKFVNPKLLSPQFAGWNIAMDSSLMGITSPIMVLQQSGQSGVL